MPPPEINLTRKLDTDGVKNQRERDQRPLEKHIPQTQLFETQDRSKLGQTRFSETCNLQPVTEANTLLL